MADQSKKSLASLTSVAQTRQLLLERGYIADDRLATVVHLALKLRRPLFLEGEPGTGKTEIAKALALAFDRPLIRLQCYEGLDLANSVYEWNYARQMLEIRLAESQGELHAKAISECLFSDKFLIRRALLQSITPGRPVPPVLLIDEIDRADQPFEAFLLEVLSDWQITVPELGTIRAEQPPIVVLTSNRTRQIHDAVKRRCIYHWVDFPDAAREAAILALRVPTAEAGLAKQVVSFVHQLREMDLYKQPGVAETIEWTRALMELESKELDSASVQKTLGLLLKYQDDIARLSDEEVKKLLRRVKDESA